MLLTALLLAQMSLFPAGEMPPPSQIQIIIRITERMDVLAQRFGLTWASAPSVQVGYGKPPQTFLDLCRLAVYTPDPPTIWINPLPYVRVDQRDSTIITALADMRSVDVGLDRVLDHELVHHYFDSEYHRLTGQFPPSFARPEERAQRLGFAFMTEGLADAVERREFPPPVPDSLWPIEVRLANTRDPSIDWEKVVYESGFRFVAPLLTDHAFTSLVEYMIYHPLVIDEMDFRGSLVRWRQEAEKNLPR